jgi:hypothetical protein
MSEETYAVKAYLPNEDKPDLLSQLRSEISTNPSTKRKACTAPK